MPVSNWISHVNDSFYVNNKRIVRARVPSDARYGFQYIDRFHLENVCEALVPTINQK